MGKGPGRDVELERRWRDRIAEQAASGLNVRDFCQALGVAEPSFYQWRREIARRDRPESDRLSSARPPSVADFLPVRVLANDDDRIQRSEVTIEMGGAILQVRRGVDEETLGRVVRVLQREAIAQAEAASC